ncbi:MAG: hypothetical protein HGB03_04205 [Candidatus Yonathbacteria bacterium]|nr:hypothetical protein [Candidatus Yonathbacteria bacterium]NTW47569.1 hypothetical protein [Candidatus Yonathbacteria bacterium]
MNKKLFPRFFVVIHVQHKTNDNEASKHVIEEATKIFKAGASGIFLIPDYENESNGHSKRATSEDLFFYYSEIKKLFPNFPVGVNFLKRFETMESDLIDAIKEKDFNMIQSDGSFAKIIPLVAEVSRTDFFTGLAFKYSRHSSASGDDLKRLCDNIPKFNYVIPTTSGIATGKPADYEKIKEIKTYLSIDQRLGIASGITEENVKTFLEIGVTDFLVATSLIEKNVKGFDILSSEKIKVLAEKILT